MAHSLGMAGDNIAPLRPHKTSTREVACTPPFLRRAPTNESSYSQWSKVPRGEMLPIFGADRSFPVDYNAFMKHRILFGTSERECQARDQQRPGVAARILIRLVQT